jgi:hypothetical protein
MAVDTSSSAAASRLVVGPAAAALAPSIVEPIPAKSAAAAVTNSGIAVTYDMRGPANLLSHNQPSRDMALVTMPPNRQAGSNDSRSHTECPRDYVKNH